MSRRKSSLGGIKKALSLITFWVVAVLFPLLSACMVGDHVAILNGHLPNTSNGDLFRLGFALIFLCITFFFMKWNTKYFNESVSVSVKANPKRKYKIVYWFCIVLLFLWVVFSGYIVVDYFRIDMIIFRYFAFMSPVFLLVALLVSISDKIRFIDEVYQEKVAE
ncbi:hypothetical protein [Colwellia sp. 12G3]|uniref:hypothetical protein n=1 Tax=Colwellia sp. 12G3 TaxID=2058299 RepID=UPI000C33EE70|nr:hypothetical protein [Colwellia sp. 12G3]PKI13928.1 hypothetical protein CXF71_15170 [Colwellia sp. 12G3]